MLIANEPSFIEAALKDVRDRALKLAEQFPAIRHMVVFPPGQTLDLPGGGGGGCDDKVQFAAPPNNLALTDGVNWNLVPIPGEWSELPAVRKIVVRPKYGRSRTLRVHRFFGGGGDTRLLDQLRDLAGDVPADELDHAIFGKLIPPNRSDQLPNTMFYSAGDVQCDEDAKIIDEWMCAIHWWAWHDASSPAHALTYVVHAGGIYPTPPDDFAVANKLSFSHLDMDVFCATVAMLDLFEGFIGKPDAVFNTLYGRDHDAAPAADGAVGAGELAATEASKAIEQRARDASDGGDPQLVATNSKSRRSDRVELMQISGEYKEFRKDIPNREGPKDQFIQQLALVGRKLTRSQLDRAISHRYERMKRR